MAYGFGGGGSFEEFLVHQHRQSMEDVAKQQSITIFRGFALIS